MLKLLAEGGTRRVALAATLFALGGCATIQAAANGEPEPDGTQALAAGVAALQRQDYLEAHRRLSAVYSVYPNEPVAAKALLALAAMELDPRNPGQRLDVGTEILGRYFMMDSVPYWQRPLLETAYLMALELGAAAYRVEVAEEEVAVAEAEAAVARQVAEEARADEAAAERDAAQAEAEAAAERRRLPELPGPSVAAQLDALRASRNEARAEAEAMATQVAQLTTQLADAQAELERIRKTIKP